MDLHEAAEFVREQQRKQQEDTEAGVSEDAHTPDDG